MAQGLKRLARRAFAILAALPLFSCYLTSQGFRYLEILAEARPAPEVLADPDTDPETRRLVETAQEVERYATEVLGLRRTGSYRSLARVPSDHLVSVVQACASLSFRRHYWNYPFVGPLPYRGYFDPGQARREAARLRELGLDVVVRRADAFSTLGVFADPLFSFMTRYPEVRIAELVIHEMTHATIFIRGARAGNFNEELATFVGRRGALGFLEARYGIDSPEYRDAVVSFADDEAFASFLRETARILGELYDSVLTDDEKRSGKAAVIAERAARFASGGHGLSERSRARAFPMGSVDNAFLDLYLLYEGEREAYVRYLETGCGGELSLFIRKLREAADPLAEIAAGGSADGPPAQTTGRGGA